MLLCGHEERDKEGDGVKLEGGGGGGGGDEGEERKGLNLFPFEKGEKKYGMRNGVYRVKKFRRG